MIRRSAIRAFEARADRMGRSSHRETCGEQAEDQEQPQRGEGQRDLPVQLQGVWVRPGDWLYADGDGIVVTSGPA